MKRRTLYLAFAGGLLVLCTLVAAQSQFAADPPRKLVIDARPISSFDLRDAAQLRFGALEFRGGLQLVSDDKDFGGLSALLMAPDGEHFISVSDKGRWFRGRIVYRDGAPAGIADAETAPLLGPDGTPLARRGWYDTESLAEDNGTIYVGIERVEQIVRFNFARDGLLARGEPIPVPADFKTFTYNKSLECLAVPPQGSPLAGTLIVVTERSLDENGNHRSFLLKGNDVGRFSVKRSDDFDVSDCAVLTPEDLLVLERRYSPARGVAMRVRRIPLASITPGALVDGRTLIVADLGFQIDNMEGLSVHRNAAGETILTMISDDNFSSIQRTILLQFALVGE